MIKVAFFAEILIPDFDGASRTMFQLIDRIDRSRYEYSFYYGRASADIDGFDHFKTKTFALPVNDDYSIALPALNKKELYTRLDEFGPQVIHIATPSLLGNFALKYANTHHIPVISIYHTHFLSYVPYYFKHVRPLIPSVESWMKRYMQRFYQACSTVYCPTQAMAKMLNDVGVANEKLKIWQRGIDTTLFSPEHRSADFFRKKTSNNNKNILFLSRLVWEKNLQTLIEIYQEIQRRQLPYNFILIGDGTARTEAERQMPTALFLGKQPHNFVCQAYASADIFVFPSVSETYGNVIIEAMASGLPAIIADQGGSAELVEHGVTGFKAEANNAALYVDYIVKLLESPLLYKSIQKAALAQVQKLDWSRLANVYFNDIDKLASQNISALKVC